jgi:hypothetical protein
MEIEDGTSGGGGGERGRVARTRCSSLLLFLLDLVLVTLFVPRGTTMTVRLVALLALRALITTLVTAANVGIYQAFLFNAGQTSQETQLASSINTLFGVSPSACHRSKRDTWMDLLQNLDQKPRFDTLKTPREKKMNHHLKKNLTLPASEPTFSPTMALTSPATSITNTSHSSATFSPPTIITSSASITTFPTTTDKSADFEVKMDLDENTKDGTFWPETCLSSWNILAALILFVLTATMNVILLSCLFNKMVQLRAKEEQLRGSFDALQRLYTAGRVMDEVNL